MAHLECGKVQIYTGDGKGKTTAALGLSLRAKGHGLDVLFLQFAKKLHCAEHDAAGLLDLEIVQATESTPEECARQIMDIARWAIAPEGEPPVASIEIRPRERPVDVLVLAEHDAAGLLDLEIVQATESTPEACARQIMDIARWAIAPEGKAPMANIEIRPREQAVDVLVLDELGEAMRRGFVTREDVEGLIQDKPATCELVLTGRGLLRLSDLADLVTEMMPVKHYFDEGLLARQGIEY